MPLFYGEGDGGVVDGYVPERGGVVNGGGGFRLKTFCYDGAVKISGIIIYHIGFWCIDRSVKSTAVLKANTGAGVEAEQFKLLRILGQIIDAASVLAGKIPAQINCQGRIGGIVIYYDLGRITELYIAGNIKAHSTFNCNDCTIAQIDFGVFSRCGHVSVRQRST